MVMVEAETRQSPLNLERGFCIALEFFDVINAPIHVDLLRGRETKQFLLQDFSTLTVSRPQIKGTSFLHRPTLDDDVVITFTRGNDIRELRYVPQGLVSAVWKMEDGPIIITEHRGNMHSDAKREEFKAKGVVFAEQVARRYFFPFTTTDVEESISFEASNLPTGDTYYFHASYLVGPSLHLGDTKELFSNR